MLLRIDSVNFLKFLKEAKKRFGLFLLFLDKSNLHKSRNVEEWLDESKDSIRVM